MSRQTWEQNLNRLCLGLEDYAQAQGIAVPAAPSREASGFATSCPLSHSTSEANFSRICESNRLLSSKRLADDGIRPLKPDSVEAALGTEDFVFFYLAPFRFPRTGCGLLFRAALEREHLEDGVATPFDSGGLVYIPFALPVPAGTPKEFLARHELPLPEHRDYLAMSLSLLFADPLDYLYGNEPRWPGPIGLTGGDCRRWTHEVRLPEQVFVRTGSLQAVFVAISRVADPPIQAMQRWCELEGVDYVPFHASREDDFESLRNACVSWCDQN